MGLFRSRRARGPATSWNERTYAVGDVHGRLDLLERLVDEIQEHAARRREIETHIVFVGDLIDRGPSSAQVLYWLHSAQRKNDKIITLLGNHEEAMLRALSNEPGMLKAWLRIGGRATLRSFGFEPPEFDQPSMELMQDIRAAVPEHITNWIASWPLYARSGDYFFCHAGVRPGVSLKRQSRGDLLWMREPFLSSENDHGAVIVHGHSVETDVQKRPNRIGIDTGAYRTGTLTALFLEDREQEFISVNIDQPAEPAA